MRRIETIKYRSAARHTIIIQLAVWTSFFLVSFLVFQCWLLFARLHMYSSTVFHQLLFILSTWKQIKSGASIIFHIGVSLHIRFLFLLRISNTNMIHIKHINASGLDPYWTHTHKLATGFTWLRVTKIDIHVNRKQNNAYPWFKSVVWCICDWVSFGLVHTSSHHTAESH